MPKITPHRISHVVRTLAALVVLLLPFSSHAFKIDTHLWVAQQVYNDISDDGRITIKLKNRSLTIPVPDDVLSAVLNHKNAFFIGHIGPDALPDVVAGQMLVHPGVADGWKTNDWLLHLLEKAQGSPVGTALAYGYLGHTSADIFSHTYVNQYAGDIFLLSDNETLVEQRHFALETYIGKHSPPYLDQNGVDQGPPHTLVTLEDEVLEFVRDNLIYDPYVAEQHSKGPYTQHLSGYVAYRNEIENAANSDTWRRIDRAVVQIIASNYGYAITAEEADALINFLNSDIIPAVQNRQNLDQDKINKLNEHINRIDATHVNVLNSTAKRLIDLRSSINQKLLERARLNTKVCKEVTREICRWRPWPLNKLCEKQTELLCEIPGDAAEAIARIDNELNGSGGLRDQQLQAANELHDLAIVVKDSSLRISQSLIDLAQVISSDTSPVKALLDNWVMDVDVAMNEYVKAAAASMINTTNPAVADLEYGAITPIVNWYDCYHLTIMGVPAPVGTGECGFRGELQTLSQAIEDMIHLVEDSTSLGTYVNPQLDLPTPAEFRAAVADLEEQAKHELIAAGIDALIDILPQEIRGFIQVLSEDMDDATLKAYFTKSEPGNARKNLIMIPDIDDRVKAEMHLRPDGTYDASKYAVVYNSIVLAKLSLLDNVGLTQLARAAGVPATIGGAPLFAGVDNLVADSVSSIDGNHQWMQIAPPYPNAVGAPYNRPLLEPGYPFRQGFGGPDTFKLWNPEIRDQLFRSLFIGPLSPGIDAPEELGNFMPLLPSDYPYRPCNANPYPDDEYDRTCGPITPVPGPEIVKGIIDNVDDTATVSGWVCATGSTDSIAYHVYVGGPAGTGILVGNGTASLDSERAVDDACQHPGQSGNHRFSFTFTDALRREHKGKPIYIHGIRGGTSNRQLVRSGSFAVPAPPPEVVKGTIDGVYNNATVQGWTCATGSTDSIAYHVYAGGPAGVGTLVGSGRASLTSGSDIAAECNHSGRTGNHRFSFTFTEAQKSAHQGKRIYIHGIRGGTDNRQLVRSGTFTVPAPVPEVVKGIIDGVYNNSTVKGWACATGSTDSIAYHVYVGGPAGTGKLVGSGRASLASETAVAAECKHSGRAGNHRFSFTFTSGQKNQYHGKPIYIHGIRGGTDNRLLVRSGSFTVPQ